MDDDSRIKELWDRYWYVVVIVILILVPFAINYFIQFERLWDVVGEDTNWLAFWPSYLSAAVSLIMIIYTAKALRNNEDLLRNNVIQLEELKRQWYYEHIPEITASFHKVGYRGYLRIVNVSKVEVQDLHIKISKNPSEHLQRLFGDYNALKKKLEKLCLEIEKEGIRNILLMENITEVISPDEYIEIEITHKRYVSDHEQEYAQDYIIYFNDMCVIGDVYTMNESTKHVRTSAKQNKKRNKKSV